MCQAAATLLNLLQIKGWKAIFRVKQHHSQNICAVSQRIGRLDFEEAVNYFICALNVRMTPRRRGVWLTLKTLSRKRAGCQMLSLDQVEKGHTWLLSALRFNFHIWLQSNTELTTYWEAALYLPSCGKNQDVISKNTIMASSWSEDARVLMYNKKSNSARADPPARSWVKKRIGAE